ncbi:hypothetical protein SCHPADRAFT_896479 [Schizopora paradoxa]|uniref:Uncharacterized protein n=1 Tax=Schizopora paradoxa TaxID=27342 RepID=A0A0H2R0C4_9AGAM|nr:hypothetical protein SCHPADRAFT_896479 [Schizopora paradoxa]
MLVLETSYASHNMNEERWVNFFMVMMRGRKANLDGKHRHIVSVVLRIPILISFVGPWEHPRSLSAKRVDMEELMRLKEDLGGVATEQDEQGDMRLSSTLTIESSEIVGGNDLSDASVRHFGIHEAGRRMADGWLTDRVELDGSCTSLDLRFEAPYCRISKMKLRDAVNIDNDNEDRIAIARRSGADGWPTGLRGWMEGCGRWLVGWISWSPNIQIDGHELSAYRTAIFVKPLKTLPGLQPSSRRLHVFSGFFYISSIDLKHLSRHVRCITPHGIPDPLPPTGIKKRTAFENLDSFSHESSCTARSYWLASRSLVLTLV